MGSDPGVPLEEVCPIPGMPMPKDGCVIPSDAPGFGMEIKDRVGSALGPYPCDEGVGVSVNHNIRALKRLIGFKRH